MNKKNFSIPISKYFEIIHPDYVWLKLVPNKSTRNFKSSSIANAIQKTYKGIDRRIKFEKKKLSIEANFKISYVVDIRKSNTNFYFIVPQPFKNIIIEKIYEIWSKVEIDEVEPIEKFSPDTSYYQLNYRKEDALSLHVDKTSNEPLASTLNVMTIQQENDRCTIVYNFLPKSQYSWSKRYERTRKKIEDQQIIEKDTSTMRYKIGLGLSLVNYVVNSFIQSLGDIVGSEEKEKNTVLAEMLMTTTIIEGNKRLSDETLKKKNATIIDAQILVASSSDNYAQREINAQAVCSSYQIIDEDGGNSLISKKVKVKKGEIIDMESYKFNGVLENSFSISEAQNFLQQPGRILMRNLGIKHIAVEEVKVPKELCSGYISLGEVKCKGATQRSYIEDAYDVGSLPLILNGSQGSGKSTFMANYFRMAGIRHEGGVIIDYIKNCEMSDEVIRYLNREDVIILDYTKPEFLQGFAFNEFKINDKMTSFEKLEMTNRQAQQVLTFVDSINMDQPLQARMRKYLSASSNIVFASGETSLKEVIRCLEDHVARAEYIKKLTEEELLLLEDEVASLRFLDEYSKISKAEPVAYVVGTKTDKIEGILDRISLLREDFKLKFMFNKGAEGNLDLAQELENGKTIIIRMPQDSFKKQAKNIIVTFLLSKIWISTELRGKLNARPRPTHICIDEVFQCPTTMRMLENDQILPQTRKFGCKFIFSSQYLNQVDVILDTLEGSGATFMLLRGTTEKDFERFAKKMEDFDYDDIVNLPKYSSLNLVYYSKGYSSFISLLPPPINLGLVTTNGTELK